ncbi:MAG: DJ-1/PfpI family protein [archaeon]
MAGKKILFVIAPANFRDEEYEAPKKILEAAGHQVVTCSIDRKLCTGMFGAKVMPALKVSEVKPFFYQGLVIAGGSGTPALWESEELLGLIGQFFLEKKLVAAICLAPAILAKAGILKGRKATVWSSVLDKKAIEILKEGGATFLPTEVVRDGIIVTASGPEAAGKFGQRILEVLG